MALYRLRQTYKVRDAMKCIVEGEIADDAF